ERTVLLERFDLAGRGLDVLLELRDRAEPDLRRTREVAGALEAVGLGLHLLELFLLVAEVLDQLALVLPARLHRARLLLELGDLALDLGEPLARAAIFLLLA